MAGQPPEALLTLTADIVAAHVGNNAVPVADMGGLIERVHAALAIADIWLPLAIDGYHRRQLPPPAAANA